MGGCPHCCVQGKRCSSADTVNVLRVLTGVMTGTLLLMCDMRSSYTYCFMALFLA